MTVTTLGLIQKLCAILETTAGTIQMLQREVAALRQQMGMTPEPDPTPGAEPAPDEPDEPYFDEARRAVRWRGRTWSFTNRKSRRFRFLWMLAQRIGEYVSAEEIAEVFYDWTRWTWPTIRRYGVRVQEDDLGPKDFPFYIRVEAEGFTLLPLD